ncbi:PKD domain-containing protein [Kribbella voronezhensis]|uniref:PKD domain-containing protein n=1 Tax=Kribbella voronezhensis TaxID=2512212 RepID=A0A4R7SZ89_9ACTN|nr:PKD domain-containing protein [Kribbella voronezhensis]TDU84056.1 PKD domain-containing protein [Kribbella voronezhensis]
MTMSDIRTQHVHHGGRRRRLLSGAVAVLLAAPVVMVWSAPQAAAANVTASLVRTVLTSNFNPPSPDPSGITYNSDRDTLLISDAEVDEVSIFHNVNLYETSRAGVLQDTGVTTSYTHEPAGIGYNPANKHVFLSDDDQARVYELAGGPDGRYGTSDDVRTSFSAAAFGGGDSEDVEYFPPTNEVFVLEGADTDVHRVSPGPDGLFNGVAPTGDDIDTEFDIGRYGVDDPEGIGFYPGRNTLLVVDSATETAYEFNRNMQLVNKINIAASNQVFAAGITVAPATNDPNRWDLYIVDRGVDNDTTPSENDGKLYEMSVALPPIGNLAPVVSVGPDQPTHVGEPLTLQAVVRDDGLPTASTTVSWQVVSGPGSVTFGSPQSTQTSATFSSAGTYVVRAVGSDSALSGSDDLVVSVVAAGGALPLDTPVQRAFDDVEQRPTGYADWVGTTLNIPNAGTTTQTIGLRFDNLEVPQGATITEAWVQFTSAGANSGTTAVQIYGVAENDTAAFTTSPTTVTSRPRTSARTTWNPAAWTGTGQAGTAQRTADIRAVAQEIVSRPGWRRGNALGLSLSGTGERRASSHDGPATPVLHVAYTVPSGNTAPVAAFTSTCTGLSCSFNGSGSSDAEGPIAGYAWDFGDSASGSGVQPSHTYGAAGTYTVALTVTDGGGLTNRVTHQVTVGSTSTGIGFHGGIGYVGNTTSPAFAIPSTVAAGDVLVLFATLNLTTSSVTGPSGVTGWTPIENVVSGSQRTMAWSKVAASTDGGQVVRLTFNGYTKVAMQLTAYSGASLGAVSQRSDATTTTAHVTPTVTVGSAGSWLLSYWADKSSTTTNWTAPAGSVTRDVRIGSGSGLIAALVADSGAPVPTGSAGGLTATTNAASRATMVSIVLTPSG